jgi:hypothetical protein
MTRDRTAAVLPPCFFAPAVAAFVAALAASPLLLPELASFFYQPHLLALTHTLTLGWVSLTMQGVLYRYVPGLTKQPVPYPRLAVVQWATFVVGAAGLVAGFWVQRWPLVTAAAALLTLSSLLLCQNLWAMLLRSPRRGVAEIGLVMSTGFLVLAATLGAFLAADKTWPLLGGSVLTNLGAHAHVAALGWVGTTIVALSFRFLPAFLLPTIDLTGVARRLVAALAVAVIVLAWSLLQRSRFTGALAAALTALVLVYVGLVLRLVAKRRMPMDWTAWHAIASVAWLACSAFAGVIVATYGVGDESGARLAASYGVAGIVGWMSNLIVGVSYKLFPGFVAGARVQLGRPPVPLDVLGTPPRLPPVTFTALNAGAGVLVLGLLLDAGGLAWSGTGALAVAGVCYGIGAGRTLSFTVRNPRGGWSPLSVLP